MFDADHYALECAEIGLRFCDDKEKEIAADPEYWRSVMKGQTMMVIWRMRAEYIRKIDKAKWDIAARASELKPTII